MIRSLFAIESLTSGTSIESFLFLEAILMQTLYKQELLRALLHSYAHMSSHRLWRKVSLQPTVWFWRFPLPHHMAQGKKFTSQNPNALIFLILWNIWGHNHCTREYFPFAFLIYFSWTDLFITITLQSLTHLLLSFRSYTKASFF